MKLVLYVIKMFCRIHYYKGKPYAIFHKPYAKLDGVWVKAVIYVALYKNVDGYIWVRTESEFYSLFKTSP